MAELLKFKQVRAGHRLHTSKLIEKSKVSLKGNTALEDASKQLASLEKKQEILEKCDRDVMSKLTDEIEIANEIEESCTYADNVIEAMTRLGLTIEYVKEKMATDKVSAAQGTIKTEGTRTGEGDEPSVRKRTEGRIRLPKITLKEYDGSFLKWCNFWDQFDAAVNKDEEISVFKGCL